MLHLRRGALSRARSTWSARELREILGPDAETAAALTGRRRREYITARAWLREIVHGRLRRPWHGFDVVARGAKPRLRRSDLDVSIAHSGDELVVGTAVRGRIGVDIEQVAPVFDQPALVRRLCTPAELDALAGLPEHERRARLTRLWSIKESYAKALGTGLALDFTTIDAARLHQRAGVRRVLTPHSADPHHAFAITWVDAAPPSYGSRRKDTT